VSKELQLDGTYKLARTGRLENPAKFTIHSPSGYWTCVDCKTTFLSLVKANNVIDARIICNDDRILLCPWCRPDSKPMTNGRRDGETKRWRA